jgi:hypothetical protein
MHSTFLVVWLRVAGASVRALAVERGNTRIQTKDLLVVRATSFQTTRSYEDKSDNEAVEPEIGTWQTGSNRNVECRAVVHSSAIEVTGTSTDSISTTFALLKPLFTDFLFMKLSQDTNTFCSQK